MTTYFEFDAITDDEMVKEIMALNASKKGSGEIPVKALQLATYECAGILTDFQSCHSRILFFSI